MQNRLYGPLPPSEELQKEYGVAAWREFMFHQVCDVMRCCSEVLAEDSHQDLLYYGEIAGCEAEMFRQASTIAEYLDPQRVEDTVEKTLWKYSSGKNVEYWEKQGRPWKKGAWVQKQLQDKQQHAAAATAGEVVPVE
jgi:hypothetical protein